MKIKEGRKVHEGRCRKETMKENEGERRVKEVK